jgi:hypothetical protein
VKSVQNFVFPQFWTDFTSFKGREITW